MTKVTIDGKELEAAENSTILEAAEKLGISIPTLCHLKGVSPGSVCRICVVEVEKVARLVPSCSYPVSEGMVVKTESRRIREARRAVLELILANHAQKCQSCNMKGGQCEFMKLSKEYWVEGLPVCNECKLSPQACYLNRGVLCLGPITQLGCDGICITHGYSCQGCRGPIKHVEEGIKIIERYGFKVGDVLWAARKYSGGSRYFDELSRSLEK
ncbi:MAG: (2Fe-2S)-binding protein [Candidatus Brockarchaeota archaeon]|nr:(2Fe-2S)-binding protein [Candidatus Brockarchaeota archaeon]